MCIVNLVNNVAGVLLKILMRLDMIIKKIQE